MSSSPLQCHLNQDFTKVSFCNFCKFIFYRYVLTDKQIDHIYPYSDEIISLIRHLYPNKATGSDGISGQMLLLCDNSVVLSLKVIFQNILATSTCPNIWKLDPNF